MFLALFTASEKMVNFYSLRETGNFLKTISEKRVENFQ